MQYLIFVNDSNMVDFACDLLFLYNLPLLFMKDLIVFLGLTSTHSNSVRVLNVYNTDSIIYVAGLQVF